MNNNNQIKKETIDDMTTQQKLRVMAGIIVILGIIAIGVIVWRFQ